MIERATASLRHALNYVRRHGLRPALHRAVARFVYGSQDFIITRVALDGPPVPDRVGEVTLRLATPHDPQLDGLDALGRRSAVLRGHVQDGDWLFIACHGERVVAARVMMRAAPTHSITAKVLKFGPGQTWDEDIFCVRDFRGKGIARHLSLFSDRYLGRLGYTETFASIGTENIPSLHMQVHKGSQFAYHVSYRRLLFYTRLRVSRQIPLGKRGSDVIASLPVWQGPEPP
jgi:GNAT superfamily N-acetyltransferase